MAASPLPVRGPGVVTERMALPAGDYAVVAEGDPVASVERKTLEILAVSLSDGTLAFQLQRLAEVPSAAVVVEGRYSALPRRSVGRSTSVRARRYVALEA